MGTIVRKPSESFPQLFEKFTAKRIAQVKAILQKAGEDAVTRCRKNGRYKDHTGNLRSSIGYVVLENGIPINAPNFEVNTAKAETPDGATGVSEASKYLNTLMAKYSQGIVLIVVAGMDYADAVEVKGYDVITANGIMKAQSQIHKLLKGLE